uniref:Uncharacterized protein n=1 Tax=Cucumis melo TaxID=3656 RepID=A0A9I9DBJ7_CUCME
IIQNLNPKPHFPLSLYFSSFLTKSEKEGKKIPQNQMGVSQETLLQIQLNMEDHKTTQDRIIIIKEIRNDSSNDQSIWKKKSMKEEVGEEEDQEINSKGKDKSTCNNINTRRTTRRRSRSNSLILKKRSRRSSSSSSSSSSRIEQRVNILRNLVPNNDNHHDDDESCTAGSLEQLFTQTADYILSLQTRVRLMKTLVDVLSDPSSSIDE